jgi:hypothetical protein
LAKPARKQSGRWAVHRFNWRKVGDWYVRLPGTTALSTHAGQAGAEAACRKYEATVRQAVSPFRCGLALHEQTSLDEGRLSDWLLDAGLTPPEPSGDGHCDWAGWWEDQQEGLSELERDKVWQGLDRLCFATVVEERPRPVVHAVVRIHWEEEEYPRYRAEPEGGTLEGLHRTLASARRQCRRVGCFTSEWAPLNFMDRLQVRDDPLELEHDSDHYYDLGVLYGGEQGPLTEAFAIPVEGADSSALSGTRKLHVVSRWGWYSYGLVVDHDDGAGGVPEIAFTEGAQAQKHRDEMERQAWQVVCPFVFLIGSELDSISSLSERKWAVELRKLGLRPPTPKAFSGEEGGIDWQAWWRALPGLTEAQRLGIRGLCDELQFYDLRLLDLED